MKPILFNTNMVCAILDSRKTVTRRVIKDKDIINAWDCESDGTPIAFVEQATGDSHPPTFPCQYQKGDILYVRETWRIQAANRFEADTRIEFKAGGKMATIQFLGCRSQGTDRCEYDAFLRKWDRPGWCPSIHMPKEAARLFLRVTDVRVERLQDITDEQAKAEGVQGFYLGMGESGYAVRADSNTFYEGPVGAFASLWNSTIKPSDRNQCGWEANPWVWVIAFKRISREDAMKGGDG